MKSPRLIEAFNTHNLADDKVRALMTARDSQRKAIMAAVNANLKSTRVQRQHVALHGPRGFGKSFMTRVIELDVAARVDEGAAAHYLLLPEEQHNLARSPDALLRFFATRLKAAGDAWQEAAFTWPSGDPQQRWREAEAELDAAIDARFGAGKGLVIAVVENFDLLLREVFASDGAEERLRKWMTRAGNRVMLFVTTTLPVDTDYERALFQAFRPVSLTAWSEDDCIAYFNRRRELAGAPPLDPSTEAKSRAVAAFIGGNPRLAQLLSNVLDADDVLSVAALLNELADELADYYRNRIDDLAPLARGLLDALIRGGEPCSPSALAKRVGTDQKTIARAFALLTSADIVSGQRASDSKEKLFSVRDRVFVHFYRLRYGGVPRDASPLVHIVELLQRFYETPKERLAQANYYLDRGHLGEARVFLDLAGPAPGQGSAGFSRTLRFRVALWQQVFPGALDQDPAAIEADLRERVGDLYAHAKAKAKDASSSESAVLWRILQAHAAVKLEREDARQLLEQARKDALDRPDLTHLVDRELFCLVVYIDSDMVRAAREVPSRESLETIDHPLLKASALVDLAWALGKLGRHPNALETADEALGYAQLGGSNWLASGALRFLALSLGLLGRHQDAIEAASRAADLALETGDIGGQAVATRYLASSLGQLGRHQDAIEAASRAADLARRADDIRELATATRYLASSLGQLGRHQDAIEAASRAADLALQVGAIDAQAATTSCLAWNLGRLGRHQDAIEAASLAADLALQTGEIGRQTVATRHLAWNLGQLGRHQDAIEAASLAADLAHQAGNINEQAVITRHRAWNLEQLGRHQDAIEAASLAADLARTCEDFFELRGSLAIYLQAVGHVGGGRAVPMMEELLAAAQPEGDMTRAWFHADDLFASITRSQNWNELLVFAERERSGLAERLDLALSGIAMAVSDLARERGRAVAFAAVTAALKALPQLEMALSQPTGADVLSMTLTIAGQIMARCDNDGLLRDLADLLEETHGAYAANIIAILRHSAAFHAAGRSESSLERIDPDTAALIRRMWPPVTPN